jgi:hypothetical protein
MFTPPRAGALAPRNDEGPNAMPGMATAFTPCFAYAGPAARPAPRPGRAPTGPERAFLLHLQRLALRYFIENQRPCGLVLDRQSNNGPRRAHGLCSTAATGMGLISLALASAPPHRLLSPRDAAERARAALKAALESLPHDRGVVPHFVHSASGAVYGNDAFSTVETAWLLAGALWSAAFLRDRELTALAARLYERVDWRHWTAPDGPGGGLLRHGKDAHGRFLACAWDRLNGETAFMYVLAAGAPEGRALPAAGWQALRPFVGSVAGLSFNNADLGLFVFQYGLDLLDLESWQAPGAVDLWAEAAVAVRANERACRTAADRFTTYRRFWGLSAGDGPGEPPRPEVYRPYSPAGPIDGTAHLTAALASVAHAPDAVFTNLDDARHDRALGALGRYGFSNVNLDRAWVSRDMVGIDAGAAVLALDNYLHDGRVRAAFHDLPCVGTALQRLRFTRRAGSSAAPLLSSQS